MLYRLHLKRQKNTLFIFNLTDDQTSFLAWLENPIHCNLIVRGLDRVRLIRKLISLQDFFLK